MARVVKVRLIFRNYLRLHLYVSSHKERKSQRNIHWKFVNHFLHFRGKKISQSFAACVSGLQTRPTKGGECITARRSFVQVLV